MNRMTAADMSTAKCVMDSCEVIREFVQPLIEDAHFEGDMEAAFWLVRLSGDLEQLKLSLQSMVKADGRKLRGRRVPA